MIKKLKYVILGGNGFIGNNLCRYLWKKGEDITVFDRNNCKNKLKNVCYIQGDFFDDTVLWKTIADKDIIVHAVSTVNPGNSNDFYMRGYNNDFIQTIKMCSWVKDTDKKILFISSGGTVYGEHGREPLSEEILPKPINHYGNIKLSIENALRIFHIQNNLNIVIARVSNPYGPGQDYKKGVGFIDAVLKHSLAGEFVEVWGDGNCVRDYIFIEDVCEFLYKLSKYEGEKYLFNISSGIGVTQNKIIDIVKELGIDVNVVYKRSRSVDVQKIVLDNSRVQNICNIKLISIEDGIKKYCDYLRNKG